MTSETTAKKDLQRLQRAIIDGLEDVKGQDIAVFNTEHLSPLFERVIVASGTSNRQTKALAASVRDAVRDAGFDKPRVEGEDNGEWIIVDCGAAVAHVMQPVIRAYYRLEEIWGEKPVRMKHGAAKPVEPAEAKPAKASRKKAAAPAKAVPAKTVVRKAAQSAAKAASAPAKAGKGTAAKSSIAATKRPASGKTATPKAPAKSSGTAASAKTVRTTKAGATGASKPAMQKMVVKPRTATKPAVKGAGKPATRTASRTPAKKKA
ncbi:ribosome silencing factor [Hydrogenophaga sp.]|uniref:ribosome silencing factor n=1 Tax=Hydrogenophaga sp. TaxID=1904254 RepID=UPI00271C02A7|nr:ribosome silencing factor [Hydrogenophaga sp.]MDO8906672.1 ribosome silencing factor [Hydrogenophaga sp.]